MVNNHQRDPKWYGFKVGTGSLSFAQAGCTISVIGNIIGVTPDVVNERMKAVGGFAQGNLVIWAKIEEAFPGVKIRRVWSYDNEDVKKNIPNVIVEVSGAPIGGYKHWVQYLGNQKLADPWDGSIKPTNSYGGQSGYCVITGEWQQDTVAVEKNKFVELVTKSTKYDELVNDGITYELVERLKKEIDELKKNQINPETVKSLETSLDLLRSEIKESDNKMRQIHNLSDLNAL